MMWTRTHVIWTRTHRHALDALATAIIGSLITFFVRYVVQFHHQVSQPSVNDVSFFLIVLSHFLPN